MFGLSIVACCCYVLWPENVRRSYASAKWVYCIGFYVVAVCTWLLRVYADEVFTVRTDLFFYCADARLAALCAGKTAALRFCFANAVFFGLHALLLLGVTRAGDPRIGLHTSLWIIKFFLWAACIIGFFFVPIDAVTIFAQVARAGAAIFLVFQIISILDAIYRINEWFLAKEATWAYVTIAIGAFALYALALAGIGVAYHLYAPDTGCRLNVFFITFTLVIMLVAVAVLYVPRSASSAGILTSGAVMAYCTYVLLAALQSEPPGDACVRATAGAGASGNDRWIQAVGFVIVLASVSYSTAMLGSSDMVGGLEVSEDRALLPYRTDFFHAIFALASMYLAMLFTSWSVEPSTETVEMDRGWISTWVKMGSKWLCEVLYIWTVIAPAVLPGRSFELTFPDNTPHQGGRDSQEHVERDAENGPPDSSGQGPAANLGGDGDGGGGGSSVPHNAARTGWEGYSGKNDQQGGWGWGRPVGGSEGGGGGKPPRQQQMIAG